MHDKQISQTFEDDLETHTFNQITKKNQKLFPQSKFTCGYLNQIINSNFDYFGAVLTLFDGHGWHYFEVVNQENWYHLVPLLVGFVIVDEVFEDLAVKEHIVSLLGSALSEAIQTG